MTPPPSAAITLPTATELRAAMRATITLTVPMPENVTNPRSGRSHWRVKHKEKLAYWLALDMCLACGYGMRVPFPSPPRTPLAHATITSHMVLGGAMDEDNAVARHKPLIDWLRSRGYIANDRRKNLRWTGFPTQRVTRKEPASITLTLTPIEGKA